MNVQVVKLIIPKQDNNGMMFDPALLESLETEILFISGGLSKYDIQGQWIHDGRIYSDNNIVYEIILDSDDLLDRMRSLTLRWKTRLMQLSMFFQVNPANVDFL